MEMAFHQKRFFPFKDGAPSIHSLRVNPSKTNVLVTTDRNVQVLRCDGPGSEYKLHEVIFLDDPTTAVDVIASGVIECPGRERIVVAYAEVYDDEDVAESTNGESNDKLFLSVIDPRAAATATTTVASSKEKTKPKPKPKGKTSSQASGPSESSSSTLRFELVAAPTTIMSVRAQSLAHSGSAAEFNGVILFRMESMVAIGFVDDLEGGGEPSSQCVRLSNEQFAAFFPEFVQFNHPVLTVDVHVLHAEERGWIAMGCADGVVRVFAGSIIDGILCGPYEVRDMRVDGPVMAVSLFTTKREGHLICNLVAACAVGHAVVYEDIYRSQLSESIRKEILTGSDKYDSIFSALAVDIDLDGEMELLIGTDDQALIAYKRHAVPPATDSSNSSKKTTGDTLPPGSSGEQILAPQWSLLPPEQWQMRAFGGIYSLAALDLNHDGVTELTVASSTGVYVFEADSVVVLSRLEAMLEASGTAETQP